MATGTSAEIRHVLTRRCATLGIPVSGTFELTPRCNLQCKMCYVRLTPEQMAPLGRELTAEEWLRIAQEAKDAGMLFLLLTGGEPTLRSDFPEIYENLAKMGFSISINTNATLLNPSIREVWHRFPPAQVNVTVYGTCREDYEALCGNPDAFDQMVEALQWLNQEGILIHMNTTIAPDNAARWLEIEQFAQSYGLDLRMTVYCFPPVRRDECGSCSEFARIEPEQAAELICRDLLYREGLDVIKLSAASLSTPPHSDCDLGVGESVQCSAGRSQFWMAWNGRMTPCGMLNQPESWPLKQSFSAAWDELRKKTADIRLCPDCVNCEERESCMSCAAVTYAETGSFSGKPEYMCKLNHAYRQFITKMASEL